MSADIFLLYKHRNKPRRTEHLVNIPLELSWAWPAKEQVPRGQYRRGYSIVCSGRVWRSHWINWRKLLQRGATGLPLLSQSRPRNLKIDTEFNKSTWYCEAPRWGNELVKQLNSVCKWKNRKWKNGICWFFLLRLIFKLNRKSCLKTSTKLTFQLLTMTWRTKWYLSY